MSSVVNICCECGKTGMPITGKDIYEHRPDLWSKKMFQCPEHKDCYVGTHEKTGEALGLLANKRHRVLKMQAHGLFDPFWKKRGANRYRCYSRLAKEMSIDINECHFGHFNEMQLLMAIEIIEEWYQ